jgi:hypothetical protein
MVAVKNKIIFNWHRNVLIPLYGDYICIYKYMYAIRDSVGTIIVNVLLILFKYTKVVFDCDIKVLLYVPHLHNRMDPLNYILILIIAFISTMSTAATCHVLVTIKKRPFKTTGQTEGCLES